MWEFRFSVVIIIRILQLYNTIQYLDYKRTVLEGNTIVKKLKQPIVYCIEVEPLRSYGGFITSGFYI